MFLLDTNVVSELRRGPKADPRVLAWNAGVSEADCWLASVTLFELRLGALLKQRRDPTQGAVLLRWIGSVQTAFAGRVVDVGVEGWLRCAELHVPDPRPLRDSLIAACALRHGLSVVTRNVDDFVGLNVAVVDPWSG